MNAREKAVVDLVINGQAAKASLKDIEKSVFSLRGEIKKMVEADDPALYAKKNAEFKQLNRTYQDMNGNLRNMTTSWQKFKTQMGGVAVGVLGGNILTAGVQKLMEFIPNLINKAAELSDSFSDIQKTTGMSAREVKEFNSQLSKIDTRTKTKDLREIAIVAGQLGIAKEDVLGFTKSIDVLNIALGDEFTGGAAEVADITGKLRNVFSDIKSDKIDVDLLHIGNALNELGASGAATGPVVADFANRIGGVGITLGLTSGQVLGLSATLQELNVSTERGGTAITKILQRMLTDSGAFANVAGIELGKFKELLNTDLYGAFVKVATGANATKEKSTEFAKTLESMGIEGAGAMEVFGKLAGNTELLKQRVDLASESLKNQNSVLAEANLKNNNLAANWEKLGKRMSAMWQSSAMMDFFGGLIGAMADTRSEGEKLAASFQEQAQSVINLDQKATPLLDKYDELKKKGKLNKEEQQKMKQVMEGIANYIPSAVTEWDKYGKVIGVNTEIGRKFIIMQKEMLKFQNKPGIEQNEKELKRLEKLRSDLVAQQNSTAKTGLIRKNGHADYATDDDKREVAALIKKANDDIEAKKALLSGLRGDYLDEKQKTADKPKTLDEKTAIANGLNLSDKEIKAKETAAKKIKQVQDKLDADLEKARIKAFQNSLDARDKEVNVVMEKYNTLRERAKGNSDDLVKIAEAEGIEMNAITQKWADEDAKIVAKNSEKKQKAYEEAQKTLHEKDLQAIALKEARGEVTPEGAEDLKLVKEQEYLQAQFIMRWGMGLQTADLERQLADNFIAQEARKRDYAVNADRAVQRSREDLQEAQFAALRAGGAFLSGAFKDQKGLAKAMFLAEKAVSVSQVIIKGIQERAALRAATALQIAAASATGIGIAAVPAIKLAGELQVAKSRTDTFTAVAGIGATVLQEFAHGGYTKAAYSSDTSGGYVAGPTIFNGKYIAGEAGGEWMASNATLRNPVAANIIGALDALQKTGQMGSLQVAPPASVAGGGGSGAPSADVMELKVMMAQMMGAIREVDSKPTTISLTEFREVDKRLTEIRGF